MTTATGLVLGAMSSVAMSLGLGELQAKSYLGQPLEAEIDLVSLDGGLDLDSIRVRQVPAAEAEAMGIDVSFTRYRFDLSVDETSGTPRVAIASTESIREPYLNMLIELRWPAGVVYREYPLLLDPAPAVNVAAAEPRQRQEPQRQSTVAAPKTPRQPQPAPVQIELAPLQTDNGRYQVQSGDTLSKIAERWREGTSQGIGETMQWLHQNNPQAFARGDIDQLRAGAVLQMPDLTAYRLEEGGNTAAPVSVSQPLLPARTADQQQVQAVAEDAAPRSVTPKVGQDAATATGGSGLLTVGAADRDDRSRELIDLLVRENESLKARVEKLENSEYLETLKQLIVLQRQQIADLRNELGVGDGAAAAEMDTLLAQVGVDAAPVRALNAGSAGEQQALDSQAQDAPVQASADAGLLNVESPAQPSQAQRDQERNWFNWFALGAVLLLAAVFTAIYAYYRKLVNNKDAEDEYADILAPINDDDKGEPRVGAAGAVNTSKDAGSLAYDEPAMTQRVPKKNGDDWMGPKVDSVDAEDSELNSDIEDVQRSFEDITLDEDALHSLDSASAASLGALDEDMPHDLSPATEQPALVKVAKEPRGTGKDAPIKSARRPDEEVKMSIAEKMSQYNPEEYRQELENLGFLELDELVDLNESDEDEVEAIIYRAMMFCEFKKFDKAVDLIESKLDALPDPRLAEALSRVQDMRGKSDGGSKRIG